jgi:hypothetical protein
MMGCSSERTHALKLAAATTLVASRRVMAEVRLMEDFILTVMRLGGICCLGGLRPWEVLCC